MLLCTACSSEKTDKQSASAWLTEGNEKVYATVDVSDGWSAEFASGAIYFYDEKLQSDTDSVAMCITLSEDVYDEYVEEAKNNDTMKELDDAIYFENEEGANYLFEEEDVHMLLTVKDKARASEAFSRLSFSEDSID